MYPFDKPKLTGKDAVIEDLRAGYPAEIAAASGDMLPEELAAARKTDSAFDRACHIAENFGKRLGWDVVCSTSTGAVRAFQRREMGTWANSAEPTPARRIEDYIGD